MNAHLGEAAASRQRSAKRATEREKRVQGSTWAVREIKDEGGPYYFVERDYDSRNIATKSKALAEQMCSLLNDAGGRR